MTICPIALGFGCKKCPLVKFCPAKGLIGDYIRPESDSKDKVNVKNEAPDAPDKE